METINIDSLPKRPLTPSLSFRGGGYRIILSAGLCRLGNFSKHDKVEFELFNGMLILHKALNERKGFTLMPMTNGGHGDRLCINSKRLIAVLQNKLPALKLQLYPAKKLLSELRGVPLFEIIIKQKQTK